MAKREHELGYIGNVWVRQNVLEKAGDESQGHKHLFDHVTLLAKGTVDVSIEGHKPHRFAAPTFISIKKEHAHKFKAVTDDVLWYCVFAIRDIDGEVTDIVPETSLPYFVANVANDYWEKKKQLDGMSISVNGAL